MEEFCCPYPNNLKGIGCINIPDVEEWKKGVRILSGALGLDLPLLLHIGAFRCGIPSGEDTPNLSDVTPAGLVNRDHWVRHSLTSVVFFGVFDRYPKLRMGSIEYEMAWIPYWLSRMDHMYTDRQAFTGDWQSSSRLLPRDFWQQNMFVSFMEDVAGFRLRDIIGTNTILWENDFPHADSTWPRSQEFLDKLFNEATDPERNEITHENIAPIFGFDI